MDKEINDDELNLHRRYFIDINPKEKWMIRDVVEGVGKKRQSLFSIENKVIINYMQYVYNFSTTKLLYIDSVTPIKYYFKQPRRTLEFYAKIAVKNTPYFHTPTLSEYVTKKEKKDKKYTYDEWKNVIDLQLEKLKKIRKYLHNRYIKRLKQQFYLELEKARDLILKHFTKIDLMIVKTIGIDIDNATYIELYSLLAKIKYMTYEKGNNKPFEWILFDHYSTFTPERAYNNLKELKNIYDSLLVGDKNILNIQFEFEKQMLSN